MNEWKRLIFSFFFCSYRLLKKDDDEVQSASAAAEVAQADDALEQHGYAEAQMHQVRMN